MQIKRNFLFLILCSFFLPSNLFADEQIKIGVSVALTGNASTYGTDIKNSIIFANKVLAGSKYKLIIEDDMCDGKTAVNVARKLIDIDHVKYVLGFACSSSLLATANLYNQAKVLVISSSASSSEISQAGDYIFRTVPSNDAIGKLLFDYVQSRHKTFGVISEETDFSQSLLQSFTKNNSPQIINIFSENFNTKEFDYKSLILRLKSKGIEGLLINSQTEATFLLALKALKEMKINIPVYGAYMPGSATFRANAGILAEGLIFADRPTAKDVFSPKGIDLLHSFNQEYQLKGWEIVFASTWEAFQALHLAITSGQEPREYLYTNKFKGIFGDYTFDANGDIKGLQFLLKSIKNGQVYNLE